MKKITCLTLIAIALLCVPFFGAFAYAEEAQEIRYADAPVISTYANTIINYTSRDITYLKDTDGGAPFYSTPVGLYNACGPVAGAEIVSFYDKYHSELIPNWQSYFEASGVYRAQNTTYVVPVMQELYSLMKTNVGGDGVTEANFKSGLTTYFNNHGYSLSFSSAISGSTLNFTTCRNAVDNNKVIVLFVTPGSIYDINQSPGSDSIVSYNIDGNHIMIAYGYVQLKYYNSTGLFRTDTYVHVVTGWGIPTNAYYRIDSSNLEAAYVVNVG